MIEPIQIAEVPGRTPRASSFAVLNRRLSNWLADRAEGIVRSPADPGTVRWIPKTPEQQAEWRMRASKARRRAATGEKPANPYTFRRSAAQAYRPNGRVEFPQPQAGVPATTGGAAPVAPTGEGEGRNVVPAPVSPSRSRRSGGASKLRRSSPSGTPIHFKPRRRPAKARRGDRVQQRPDFQNLDQVILQQLISNSR